MTVLFLSSSHPGLLDAPQGVTSAPFESPLYLVSTGLTAHSFRSLLKYTMFKSLSWPRWLDGLEHRPVHPKVTGSIPSQGVYRRLPIEVSLASMFLSSSCSLPSSLKIHTCLLGQGLKIKFKTIKSPPWPPIPTRTCFTPFCVACHCF